jgi:hypothetical protein
MPIVTPESHNSQRSRKYWTVLATFAVLLAWGVVRAETTVLEGRILDAAGEPVVGYRVVARIVGGTEPFLSRPSDEEGRYSLSVPAGNEYSIVALFSPTGRRVALGESEPFVATAGRLTRDVTLSRLTPPTSRGALGGANRLFFSFVEDPAITPRQYLEIQLDAAWDGQQPDISTGRLIGAFGFSRFSRLEIGLRAGYAEIRHSASSSESGMTDLDVWAKFLLQHSRKWGTAVGALVRLPTGDADRGLGQDSVQTELFLTGSRSFGETVLVGSAGAVFSQDGKVAGQPLEGRTALSAGLGVIAPLSQDVGLVFEAGYDGERLRGLESESLVLAGLDWQVHLRGKLRIALAAGLESSSPDGAFLLGYAWAR